MECASQGTDKLSQQRLSTDSADSGIPAGRLAGGRAIRIIIIMSIARLVSAGTSVGIWLSRRVFFRVDIGLAGSGRGDVGPGSTSVAVGTVYGRLALEAR